MPRLTRDLIELVGIDLTGVPLSPPDCVYVAADATGQLNVSENGGAWTPIGDLVPGDLTVAGDLFVGTTNVAAQMRFALQDGVYANRAALIAIPQAGQDDVILVDGWNIGKDGNRINTGLHAYWNQNEFAFLSGGVYFAEDNLGEYRSADGVGGNSRRGLALSVNTATHAPAASILAPFDVMDVTRSVSYAHFDLYGSYVAFALDASRLAATTGDLRGSENFEAYVRNDAGTGNLRLVGVGSDAAVFGASGFTNGTSLTGATWLLVAGAETQLQGFSGSHMTMSRPFAAIATRGKLLDANLAERFGWETTSTTITPPNAQANAFRLISSTGDVIAKADTTVAGTALTLVTASGKLGFFAASGAAKQAVVGVKVDAVAASILAALAAYGIVTDNTT